MSLFGGGANPYDDIVVKATDENLTSENWEIILNLCDKVQDEGEQGARNVIAAILKRLAHRNPNVQLYSLALAESLTKNCGKELHAEIASRAFTQGLERLITDRTAHDRVKRKALGLIAEWASEWENDPTLGLMEECYNNLKSKNYSFDVVNEPPPPAVDDEARRREEEELQRALEISMQDKGGRQQWAQYSLAGSSSAGASGSASASAGPGPSSSGAAQPATVHPYASGGYVPSAQPSSAQSYSAPAAQPAPEPIPDPTPAPSMSGPVTRVRALHPFEATEPGELAFERGDIIKVVDRGYKDWWRGQLRGRTGIFPVNYVEPLPEPTANELAAEAQAEANVFAQAANIDRLLSMLRQIDPAKDNLADNEEIQELYRTSVLLRPKIVKLIDKYSQKRADLVAMNESFVKARTIFDRMMEESLARNSVYDQPYGPQPYPDGRWSTAPYEQQPAPGYGYPGYGPEGVPQLQHQSSYGGPQQVPYQQPYGGPYNPQGPLSPGLQSQPELQRQQTQPVPVQQQPQTQQQPVQQQPIQQQPVQQQPIQQQQPAQQQPAVQQQAPVQQQPAQQQQPAVMEGPPYPYDPNATYPDPNAQAWAQYYAHGGDDPTGSVYFHSVPGIKPPAAPEQSPTQMQPAHAVQSTTSLGSATSLDSPYGAQQQQQQYAEQQPQQAYEPQHQPTSPGSAGPAGAQSFVNAIQQQQQQQHAPEPIRQDSLPNPYTGAGGADLARQSSLPSPYAGAPGQEAAPVPYGQSPYAVPQQSLPGPEQQLSAQMAAMHVGGPGA